MPTPQMHAAGGRALALLAARVGLVAVTTVLVWLMAFVAGRGSAYPPSPMLVTLGLVPANVITLWLVARILRAEGQRLPDLFGLRHGRGLAVDLAWGSAWIVVLYLPFVGTVLATMWVLHGAETFAAFETVFVNPDAAGVDSPGWSLVAGVLAVVTFAPLNAPAEEAVYRGYALSRLSGRWSRAAAVAVCSVAFGVQHAFFAPSTDAMVVYVAAFTVWGLGSSLIVLWQKRLMPITVAHFLVNLMTSSPAVVVPLVGLASGVPG